MVVSLGPGKFYGTSLPRPWIYTDVKFNDHRVDPPVSVTDPLMSWAEEAHWSMGGLSVKRLRLQGKIEGNIEKLRSQREKLSKAQAQAHSPQPFSRPEARQSKRAASPSPSPSPPPAPVASKRRRFMDLIEEGEKKNEETVKAVVPESRGRRLVKKLGDDFDRVASSENEGSDAVSSDSVALKTRRRRLVKVGDAVKVFEEADKSSSKANKSKSQTEKSPLSGNGVRTSPRLAKRGSK